MADALARYSITDAKLAELRAAYAGRAFDCATTAGMECAVVARGELRGYRVSVEDERKRLKEPILEAGRTLDAEADRVKAELLALEEPIVAAIDAAKKAKADAAEAKRKAEIARLKAIADEEERVAREAREAQIREMQAEAERTQEAAKAEREKLLEEKRTAAAERKRLDDDAREKRLEADRVAGEERARLRRIEHDAAEAARLEREKLDEERRQRFEADDRAAAERKAEIERHVAEQAVEAGRAELDRQTAGTAALINSLPTTLLEAAVAALELLESRYLGDELRTIALRAAIQRAGVTVPR